MARRGEHRRARPPRDEASCEGYHGRVRIEVRVWLLLAIHRAPSSPAAGIPAPRSLPPPARSPRDSSPRARLARSPACRRRATDDDPIFFFFSASARRGRSSCAESQAGCPRCASTGTTTACRLPMGCASRRRTYSAATAVTSPWRTSPWRREEILMRRVISSTRAHGLHRQPQSTTVTSPCGKGRNLDAPSLRRKVHRLHRQPLPRRGARRCGGADGGRPHAPVARHRLVRRRDRRRSEASRQRATMARASAPRHDAQSPPAQGLSGSTTAGSRTCTTARGSAAAGASAVTSWW